MQTDMCRLLYRAVVDALSVLSTPFYPSLLCLFSSANCVVSQGVSFPSTGPFLQTLLPSACQCLVAVSSPIGVLQLSLCQDTPTSSCRVRCLHSVRLLHSVPASQQGPSCPPEAAHSLVFSQTASLSQRKHG